MTGANSLAFTAKASLDGEPLDERAVRDEELARAYLEDLIGKDPHGLTQSKEDESMKLQYTEAQKM